MNIVYTVQSGDTIYDVAYNTTGSLAAVDAIMEANGILDYSALLTAGTVLEFDAEIQNNAATLRASVYPFSSSTISEDKIDSLINDFVSRISMN